MPLTGTTPFTARLVVNGKCNFKCFFCYQEGTAYQERVELSPQDFVAAVGAFSCLRPVKKIRITGGEPLLYDGLGELIGRLYDAVPAASIGVTTNASLPDRVVSLVRKYPRVHLNISLPSMLESTFRSITGSKHLGRVLTAVEQARNCGATDISINFVYIHTLNAAELEEMLTFSRTRGLRLKIICLTENEFNESRLKERGCKGTDLGGIQQRLVHAGYTEGIPDEWSLASHRVSVVNCFNQSPIPYFQKYRTLRFYYDGRIAVTGDNDGFSRPLRIGSPMESISTILRDVEREAAIRA